MDRETQTQTTVMCDHTECPDGYCEWHEWAEKMQETHDQCRCPVCGLFAVWIKKKSN